MAGAAVGRVKPFADVTVSLPAFTTKPRKEAPFAPETIAKIAADNRFPSRQARKATKPAARTPRASYGTQPALWHQGD